MDTVTKEDNSLILETNTRLFNLLKAVEKVLEWDYGNLISNDSDGCQFYQDLKKLERLYNEK